MTTQVGDADNKCLWCALTVVGCGHSRCVVRWQCVRRMRIDYCFNSSVRELQFKMDHARRFMGETPHGTSIARKVLRDVLVADKMVALT